MVTLALFDRVEVSPLEILDECEGEKRLIIDLLDDSGDLFPSDVSRSAQAALAGNELEAVFAWTSADSDRLKEAACAQAFFKVRQLFCTKFSAWLEGIPRNLCDWD